MREYIDRGAAIKAVMAAKWKDGYDGAMAMEIVASASAADVVPAQQWISVKDRLPEGDDCEGVLVVVNGRFKNVFFSDGITLADYDPKESSWIIDSFPEWKDPHVSWWMPLPKLPKEVQ